MKIASDSFEHGGRIPAEFAMGTPEGFGGNRNPHLRWDDVPAGTRSFVLLCIDTDVPTDGALVADAATPIPVQHPRGEFTLFEPLRAAPGTTLWLDMAWQCSAEQAVDRHAAAGAADGTPVSQD